MAVVWLNRAKARAALGDMPERTFALWCSRGLPRKGEGVKARYPWPEVFRWYAEQIERRTKERAKIPTTIDEAEKREATARAELAEIELEERRNNLMTVGQFQLVVGSAFERVRGQLQTLPVKLASEVVGVTSVPEALENIEPMVRELMEELHDGGDVPDPADEPEEDEVEVVEEDDRA